MRNALDEALRPGLALCIHDSEGRVHEPLDGADFLAFARVLLHAPGKCRWAHVTVEEGASTVRLSYYDNGEGWKLWSRDWTVGDE